MSELAIPELRAIAVLIAFAPLMSTLIHRGFSRQQRKLESLLQRIDRESAQRQRRIDREWAQRRQHIDRESAERQQQYNEEAARLQQRLSEESATRQHQIDKESAARQHQIDKESELRERTTQLALERSDRVFGTLTARKDEFAKELAVIGQRIARIEGKIEALMEVLPHLSPQPTSQADYPRGIAAQHIPEEPSEE